MNTNLISDLVYKAYDLETPEELEMLIERLQTMKDDLINEMGGN